MADPDTTPLIDAEHPSRIIVVAVCVAMVVVGLNTTAVGVATRGMADELGVSLDILAWIMSAYLVTAAAFAMIGGRLGDVAGRVRTFIAGLGIFGVGCIVAAVAPGAIALIAGRAVQGLGAALVMPSSIELLVAYGPDKGPTDGFRARNVTYAAAFGVGPLVGGVLTDNVSWRAVFWCELVILAVALGLILPYRKLKSELPRPQTRDFWGAALLAAIVFTFMLGASRFRVWGWTWPVLVVAVVVVGLAVVLVRVEARTDHPLLHPSLLRDRTVLGANLASLGASIGIVGVLYFFNVFAQSAAVFDYTAVAVAVSLGAFTLSIVLFALLSGLLTRLFGFRGPVAVGLGISIVGFFWLSTVTAGTTEGQLVIPLALCGIGAGIANAGLTTPSVLARRVARLDEAAGLASLTRFFGSAVAVLIGTSTYLTVAINSHASELAVGGGDPAALATGRTAFKSAASTLQSDLRAPFEAAAKASTAEAFASTMRLTAIALATITIASTLLLARARRETLKATDELSDRS